jgi:energy-coupling factor transporter ATP-binding protein EcfA2
VRVARIRIQNVMGIEELEIQPGAVTVLTGKNASGKTSVLEAIRSAVNGGHDASLIRNGAEKAEVVLVLDDGTELRKRITTAGSVLTVKHPELGNISKGQTWINGLSDALAFNPVEFLTCDDARRVQYVLDTAQLTLDTDAFKAAVGGLLRGPMDTSGHPLRVIEQARKQLYDERTGRNAVARDSKVTVQQLRASIPADMADPAVLQAQADALDSRQAEVDLLIEAAEREVWESVKARVHSRMEELDAGIAELEQKLAQLRSERATLRANAESEQLNAARAAVPELRAERSDLARQIAATAQALDAAERVADSVANTRAMIETHQKKADAAASHAAKLTDAIGRLDSLRDSVMEQSPIKGLDIRDGQLFWGDVPWPRVNHAQRVKIAMQLAKHRAKDLPLACVDGLEALDAETFDAFVKAAPKSGLQFIVTRVGTEPGLTVATFDFDEQPAGVA